MVGLHICYVLLGFETIIYPKPLSFCASKAQESQTEPIELKSECISTCTCDNQE